MLLTRIFPDPPVVADPRNWQSIHVKWVFITSTFLSRALLTHFPFVFLFRISGPIGSESLGAKIGCGQVICDWSRSSPKRKNHHYSCPTESDLLSTRASESKRESTTFPYARGTDESYYCPHFCSPSLSGTIGTIQGSKSNIPGSRFSRSFFSPWSQFESWILILWTMDNSIERILFVLSFPKKMVSSRSSKTIHLTLLDLLETRNSTSFPNKNGKFSLGFGL